MLVASALLVSCGVRYERLTFQRTSYFGTEIMTNGYFYCMDTLESHFQGKLQRKLIARTLFFYRNGVVLSSNKEFYGFDDLESSFADIYFLSALKDVPYVWGIFIVDDREVILDRWAPGVGGRHPSFVYKIEITDRSTLFDSQTGNTYRFRAFENKPDSVNRFTGN
jgi:hypothetical protein